MRLAKGDVWVATNSNGSAKYRFDGERLVLISDVDDSALWPVSFFPGGSFTEFPKMNMPTDIEEGK